MDRDGMPPHESSRGPDTGFPEGLWKEILAKPGQVAPRLVLADWLADRGDPRADLIRWQCVSTDDLSSTDTQHGQPIQQRIQSLINRHFESWVETPFHLNGVHEVTFARGFPDAATVSTNHWNDGLDALSQHAPLLSRLTVLGDRHPIEAAIELRHGRPQVRDALPELVHLEFRNLAREQPEKNWLDQFEGLPLTSLVWSYCRIAPGELAVFLENSPAPSLRRLEFVDQDLGLRPVHAIGSTLSSGRLEHLRLKHCRLADADLQDLTAIENLDSLRSLDLSGNRLGVPALRTVVTQARLSRLKELYWDRNPLGMLGAAVLARSPLLPQLEFVSLKDCGMGSREQQLLSRSAPSGLRFEF